LEPALADFFQGLEKRSEKGSTLEKFTHLQNIDSHFFG